MILVIIPACVLLAKPRRACKQEVGAGQPALLCTVRAARSQDDIRNLPHEMVWESIDLGCLLVVFLDCYCFTVIVMVFTILSLKV